MAFVLDGQEDLIDTDKPLDVLSYEMVSFGDWQTTNVFPAYLAYSTTMVDNWFDPKPRLALDGKRVAVCGYGSSIKDEIETIRNGNYDCIITTSGAHGLLLEAGIVPNYHVEIDWKPHKSEFTKNAHPDVEYLVSATCHPSTIDNVRGGKCKLIFVEHGPEINYPDESMTLPPGYDAGQTCIIVAKILGYRELDLFGFDYSFSLTGHRHAGPHGGRIHHMFEAKVENKRFLTSKTMFTGLLVMEHFLKQNPDLNIQIYSDALLLNFLEGRVRQLAKEKELLNAPST